MSIEEKQPTKLAYSIKEACEATSLGRTTIYALIAEGRIIARRIGGRTVIPAESLHTLIAVQETPTGRERNVPME